MPNPFAYGARISNPDQFVGRAAELRRVFAALDTVHTGQLQSISIVGPRRIGKSSLLYHLTQIYNQRLAQPERYVVAYADLEGAKYEQLDSLLKGLLNGLRDALPPDADALRQHLRSAVDERKLSLAEFETAIEQFSRSSAPPLYPVICLDEFEHLVKYPDEFPDRVYDSWRSLMNASHLALVIASAKPLNELSQSKSLTSPFFNIFSEFISLGNLTDEEAWSLISRGKTCDRPFTDYDCLEAIKLAGLHPLKLQLAGSLIYAAKGEPRLNWKAIEQEYRQKTSRIFAGQPTSELHGKIIRLSRFIFIRMPQALGYCILMLRGQPSDDEKLKLVWGWTVFLLIIPIILAAYFFGLLPAAISLLIAIIVIRILK